MFSTLGSLFAFTALNFGLLLLAQPAKGQPQSNKAVIVPQEAILQLTVPQADSPLSFEKANVLRYLNGGFGLDYLLRNVGSKPITEYTVAVWNSDNTGDVITWHVNHDEGPLMPGARSQPQHSNLKLLSLSPELQKSLDLDPPMRGLVFFMIVNAKSSDGNQYDASNLFERLKEHLKNFERAYEKRSSKPMP
jgi:hypothetical protein